MVSLDLDLDEKIMDIRSVTGHGLYSNIFLEKNKQLLKYNSRDDVEKKSYSLCLYFHDPALFDEKNMKKSINYYKYYRGTDGNIIQHRIKHIYCVIRGRKELLIYDI